MFSPQRVSTKRQAIISINPCPSVSSVVNFAFEFDHG